MICVCIDVFTLIILSRVADLELNKIFASIFGFHEKLIRVNWVYTFDVTFQKRTRPEKKYIVLRER